MGLEGKKVLMVIAANNFRDEEYAEPRKVLEKAGASVTVACSTMNTAKGKLGTGGKAGYTDQRCERKPTMTASCSWAGEARRNISKALLHTNLRRTFTARASLPPRSALRPAILANAGLLTAKKATSFSSSRENLQAKGAVFTGSGVESDGVIVTGSGPEAAGKFGEKLVEVLGRK